MAEPVRLRGEVGERRRKDAPEYPVPGFYLVSSSRDADGLGWGKVSAMCQRLGERRTNLDVAARVDECIAAAKAPLLRVIEEQAAEIERLRAECADLSRHRDWAMEKLRSKNAEAKAERIKRGQASLVNLEARAPAEPMRASDILSVMAWCRYWEHRSAASEGQLNSAEDEIERLRGVIATSAVSGISGCPDCKGSGYRKFPDPQTAPDSWVFGRCSCEAARHGA